MNILGDDFPHPRYRAPRQEWEEKAVGKDRLNALIKTDTHGVDSDVLKSSIRGGYGNQPLPEDLHFMGRTAVATNDVSIVVEPLPLEATWGTPGSEFPDGDVNG